MSKVEDLQGRMARALDRLAAGLDGLEPPKGDAEFANDDRVEEAENRATEAELQVAELKSAHAALEDRLKIAEEDRASAGSELETALAALQAAEAQAARLREELQLAQDTAAAATQIGEEITEESSEEAEPSAPVPPSSESGDAETLQMLKDALDDERLANAQLQARLEKLKASTSADTTLKDQLAAQRAVLVEIDSVLQGLRDSNTTLTENCASLRAANAQGLGDPDLINASLTAELEALQAMRVSEAAELKLVVAALEPLLAEAGMSEAQS